MKKSLLVFCFVTMALGVFAEGDNVEDVEVTAQVVPKLDITTEAVEFGTVVANTDNNKPEKLGKIIIKGTGYEQKMKIKFADASGSNWTENPNDLKIQLVNKEHSENKLTYTPELIKEKEGFKSEDGNTTMNITGTLKVPENAVVGNYSGVLKVKVWYDEI